VLTITAPTFDETSEFASCGAVVDTYSLCGHEKPLRGECTGVYRIFKLNDIFSGPRSQTLGYRPKRIMCDAESAMNVKPGRFDPYEFEVKKVRKNLKSALSSRASVRSGSKKMVMPVRANGE
jgi:hypothetical protein